MYSVLVVGLVGDTAEVSTSFLGGVLRLQQNLAMSKDTSVQFEFQQNIKDAIAVFLKGTYDRLVMIDSLMGIDADWILKKHPSSVDVVVAAYPLREISWDRVAARRKAGETDPERLRKASYTYNFTASSDECQDLSYIKASSAQAKIVSLSRAGATSFLDTYCPYSRTVEGEILVDLSAKGTNAGPFDFVGCVGTRLLQNTANV